VRRDVAHQTSHTLVADPRYKLFVFEALKVKNMTQKAKPKQDEGAAGYAMAQAPSRAQQVHPGEERRKYSCNIRRAGKASW
jgi:hypothetical protein